VILVWAGPVMASTMANAPWRGDAPRIVTISGAGSSYFAALGRTYEQRGGTVLRGLLEAHGIDPDTDEPIALSGFSAAHGLLELALRSEADRARVRAVGAFDAYYIGTGQGPKPGYLAYAEEAAARVSGRAMVLTTSHNAGQTYPSATEAVGELLAGLELEDAVLLDVPPAECERARRRGALRWYVYANRRDVSRTHDQHANVIAPAVMPSMLAPDRENNDRGGLGTLAALAGALWLALEARVFG
jgi:hypothetical protein